MALLPRGHCAASVGCCGCRSRNQTHCTPPNPSFRDEMPGIRLRLVRFSGWGKMQSIREVGKNVCACFCFRFFFFSPQTFLSPGRMVEHRPPTPDQWAKALIFLFKTKIIPFPVASNQHTGGTPPLLGRQKEAEIPLQLRTRGWGAGLPGCPSTGAPGHPGYSPTSLGNPKASTQRGANSLHRPKWDT